MGGRAEAGGGSAGDPEAAVEAGVVAEGGGRSARACAPGAWVSWAMASARARRVVVAWLAEVSGGGRGSGGQRRQLAAAALAWG